MHYSGAGATVHPISGMTNVATDVLAVLAAAHPAVGHRLCTHAEN
jgi:hypothetical protein